MTTVAAESKLRDAKAKLLKANNQVVRENSQLLGRLRTAEMDNNEAKLNADRAAIELAMARDLLALERQQHEQTKAKTKQVVEECAVHLVYVADLLRQHLDELGDGLGDDVTVQDDAMRAPTTTDSAAHLPPPPRKPTRARKSLRVDVPVRLQSIYEHSTDASDDGGCIQKKAPFPQSFDKENSINQL